MEQGYGGGIALQIFDCIGVERSLELFTFITIAAIEAATPVRLGLEEETCVAYWISDNIYPVDVVRDYETHGADLDLFGSLFSCIEEDISSDLYGSLKGTYGLVPGLQEAYDCGAGSFREYAGVIMANVLFVPDYSDEVESLADAIDDCLVELNKGQAEQPDSGATATPVPTPTLNSLLNQIGNLIVGYGSEVEEVTLEQQGRDLYVVIVVAQDLDDAEVREILDYGMDMVSRSMRATDNWYNYRIRVLYPDSSELVSVAMDAVGMFRE